MLKHVMLVPHGFRLNAQLRCKGPKCSKIPRTVQRAHSCGSWETTCREAGDTVSLRSWSGDLIHSKPDLPGLVNVAT